MELRRLRATCPALATAALLVLVACAGDDAAMGDAASGPSIEGSYLLVARDLPDGTTLEPPEIFGLMTFTDGLRHFHIYAPGADGGLNTTSHVAEYNLDDARYTQTTLYSVTNDEAAGGLSYTLTADPGTAPVTLGSGTIQFDEVGDGGPTLVFTDNGLTATLEGAFVDHWEKME